ncbi:4Fe-4S binding protein [bacterium]|nr:4Fe-4S binding protein [bacterium]
MNDNNNSQTIHLKKEILVRLIKAFYTDNFEENTRLIPYDMRPKGAEVPYRCCIYKERAIIKDREIAGLGFQIEEDDELTSLTTYAKRAKERTEIDNKHLTVLQAACKGCVPSQIYVTDLCQGCVARPCQKVCKFDAISVENGKSKINSEKCKKCKMCISACPYNAILKVTVPCEDVCPVGAIEKDEHGFAKIDYDKCINCGRCISACPFGAVHEKSQIIDILKTIKSDYKLIALIAPSIAGQFSGSIYQIKSAILKAGFDDVFEVAQGADITAKNEAEDFIERINLGKPFMTTSCCAGYNQLIKKHLPEIKPFVSDTKTPLYYTAEIVKNKYPDAKLLFVSPCVAKRTEVYENPNIDFTMSMEELEALFIAKDIDVSKCDEIVFKDEPSKQGREFGVLNGVSEAVKMNLKNEDLVKPCIVSGLNKDTIKKLRNFALNNKCENDCNLIEVMCCDYGCISGNATINNPQNAKKIIEESFINNKDIENHTDSL